MKKDRNTIFISYPSDDAIIATCVSTAIKKMQDNRLDIFLDRDYIRGGAKIPDSIRDALKKTVYFVAIGTNVARRNFDWCGQELGFYQATHPDEDRRETCLFDKTLPELFVERKSYKVQALKPSHLAEFDHPIVKTAESGFYEFFREIADLNSTLHPPPNKEEYWRAISTWADKYANALTDRFLFALQSRVKDEWYPQGRLELSITRGDFYNDSSPSIPLDAQVSMSASTYRIFRAAAPATPRPFTWDEFIDYVTQRTGSDALTRIISDIIISALPDKDEAKNDYVFQASNEKFYRVLLVKHSVYGNKRRDLIVNFVETREKVKSGDQDTTALVAGIVLGSKYRSIFLEQGAKYENTKLKGLSIEALVDEITYMLRDIDRISADAASDGLADYSALQVLFGDTVPVRDLFRKWSEVHPPMEAAAKQFINEPTPAHQSEFFAAYEPFLAVSRSNNKIFLELCMDEYRRRL